MNDQGMREIQQEPVNLEYPYLWPENNNHRSAQKPFLAQAQKFDQPAQDPYLDNQGNAS